MRWAPDPQRVSWSAVLALTLAACGDVTPVPTFDPEPTRAGPTAPPQAPRVTPSPSDDPLGARLPRPGRPYTALDILEAMRESRRPGGVPDQLETEPIADEIAGAIWTVGGQPWSSIAAGGSCGPARCTLDVSGSHDAPASVDLWSFEIIPASGEVIVLDANLRSLPADLLPFLDRAARDELGVSAGEDLVLAGVRWIPPPDEPAFVLSYRSGDEEGSCQLEVRLDSAGGGVEVLSRSGC